MSLRSPWSDARVGRRDIIKSIMSFLKKNLNAFWRFLRTVGRSCYDMELYREVRTRPWPRALGYFTVFNVFIVCLTLADLTPSSFIALKQGRQFIADNFPAGAAVEVRSGKLETNLPSPTRIGDGRTSVVIDASVSGLGAQPEFDSEAGFLLGRDVMVIQRSANDRRTVALSELPDFAVTRETALDQIDRYGGWMVSAAMLLFGILYLLTSFIGGVIFVLFTAVVAALFGAMWKIRLGFGQWVAVGFHAVTLPTLANALFNEFGMNVPLVFTFLFFMIVVAVIADERSSPTGGSSAAVAPPPTPAGPSSPAKPLRRRPVARKKPAKPRTRRRPPAAPPPEV